MIIRALLSGLGLGLGSWLLLRGYFAPRQTLSDRVEAFGDKDGHLVDRGDPSGTIEGFALRLLEAVHGDSLMAVAADVAVTDGTLAKHALEKLKASVACGFIVSALAFIVSIVDGLTGLAFLFIVGSIGGYFLPDIELRSKAEERR